jgi:hypothetical protein
VLAFEVLVRPAADYGFSGSHEVFELAEDLLCACDLDAACMRAVLAQAARLSVDTRLFMNLIV